MSNDYIPLKINMAGYKQWHKEDPMLASLYMNGHVGATAVPALLITDDPADTYERVKEELKHRQKFVVADVYEWLRAGSPKPEIPAHVFRECVNQLTATARTYAGTQQLREQMKKTLGQFINTKS